jgi:hypothetical protein
MRQKLYSGNTDSTDLRLSLRQCNLDADHGSETLFQNMLVCSASDDNKCADSSSQFCTVSAALTMQRDKTVSGEKKPTSY